MAVGQGYLTDGCLFRTSTAVPLGAYGSIDEARRLPPVDFEHLWFCRRTIGEGPVLTGFKFAVQSGQRPVYRRRRFEYIDALLSGPAVAGLFAVLSARRNAFRAWLSESAFRSLVVGALALGVGVQASSSPSGAQSPTKGRDTPSHVSTAGPAAVGGGFAGGFLKLSEFGAPKAGDSDADRRANRPSRGEAAPAGGEGGEGWRLSASGAGAASALGEPAGLFIDVGLDNMPGAPGSYSKSAASGHDDPGSDSSKPDSASSNSDLAAFASDSAASPPEGPLPDAKGVLEWKAAFSPTVLAERAGRGSIEIAGRSGPRLALRSSLTFADLLRRGPGAGSTGLGAASPSRASPARLDVPRPSGAPEPATWAIVVTGVALAGAAARDRRRRGLGRA